MRDVTTGDITPYRLSYDHKPYDPKEAARIRSAGGSLVNHQVENTGRGLSVARSFGDFDAPGITHVPDVVQMKTGHWVNHHNHEVYLLQGCDGVFETVGDHAMAKLAKEKLGIGAGVGKETKLAKHLSDAAIYAGSRDNVTLSVTRVSPGQTEDILSFLADGHSRQGVISPVATSELASREMGEIARERPAHGSHQSWRTFVETGNSPPVIQPHAPLSSEPRLESVSWGEWATKAESVAGETSHFFKR